MVSDQRITYRRNKSFATRSNKIKKVRTPGGRLTIHYTAKKVRAPSCGDCGSTLRGLPCIPAYQYSQLKKADRTVKRAYGGSRCHSCVRDRIVRAFLIEEHKIVKRVSKAAKSSKKSA
eukprot:TRINITY_DN1981_c0_g1_i1.p1 TRINITY_DN1981_c0_g1~~TRINITY_DN1981_c0_g1_i1.p1  ORF type:complete len:118 (+),score=34.39 TRINITY_DN1981_c0_g1_i1:46-399(+)